MSLRIRRGGAVGTGVGDPGGGGGGTPSAAYGPVEGAAAVRAGVGPNTVPTPTGTVYNFSTMAQLETNINAQAANSIHVATASSYVLSGNPVTGWAANKHPRIYCPGAPGATAVFEGGGGDNFIGAYTGGLEWRGGRFQNVGNLSSATFMAAILTRPPAIVEDVTFTNCYKGVGVGVTVGAPATGCAIRRLDIVDSLFAGVTAGSTSADQLVDFIMEYCHVSGSNTGNFNPGGTAAGTKWLQAHDCIFRFNHFEDNNAWGLWFDSAGPDLEIHDNVSENNARAGLFFERSHGPSHIHHNYTNGNSIGGTIGGQSATELNSYGINIRNSDDVEVDHNDVDELRYSLVVGNIDPGDAAPSGLDIHDNRIYLRASNSRIGGSDNRTPEELWDVPVTWADNLYMVASMTDPYWKWGAAESANTWAQWQARGFDTTGTRELIA